jgi:integrating conjugative element protein (TIGR03758 family)
MSPAQLTAFQAASGVTAVVWVLFGSFRAWQDGKASLFDLAWSALRASIILMVLGFYLR